MATMLFTSSATVPQPATTSGAADFLLSLQRNPLTDTFLEAGPVVKLVLLLLIFLSVISWGIILYKYLMLRRTYRVTQQFLDLFSGASSLQDVHDSVRNVPSCPLQELFEAGYLELSRLLGAAGSDARPPPDGDFRSLLGHGVTENVERAMIKAKTLVNTRMERYLTFLASTGSTAPFIGLFGTVWGIMTAFRSISVTGSANLATVAPGIAEALVATALGLFAAIPAVVAYNYFLQRVRILSRDMETFSTDLINLIHRQLQRQPPERAERAGR